MKRQILNKSKNLHKKKESFHWELGIDKFLTQSDVLKLKTCLRKRRDSAGTKRLNWVEWFFIELGLNSGMRISEIVNTRCGDIFIRNELSYLFVRRGKGGKSRQILINSEFCKDYKEFIEWKIKNGEKVGDDDFLLHSPKSKAGYSTRALEYAFKRCADFADIEFNHSPHHLRHTFASLVFESSNHNSQFVQRQLGHASDKTTKVYTHLFNNVMSSAVENMFWFTKERSTNNEILENILLLLKEMVNNQKSTEAIT